MAKQLDPVAQRYFVPELNLEIKVEKVSTKVYVAHFPDGAERVRLVDMNEAKWENRGRWEAKGDK